MKNLLLFCTIAMLSACISTSQNVPDFRSFPVSSARPDSASLFVDQNGSIYPDDWQAIVARQDVLDAGSLLNATVGDPEKRKLLSEGANELLLNIGKVFEDKDRVVILIHGYNNTPSEAGLGFHLLEQRVAWRPNEAVVHFYWDGLVGSGGGELPVWFAASGSSQLAGSRGLRQLLNVLSEKELILVAHSRGASVALSAISNPTYSFNFRERTRRLEFAAAEDFLRPPPLVENVGHIKLVLLGGAIGYPDFWSRNCEQTRRGEKRCGDPIPTVNEQLGSICSELRNFSPHLRSVLYTVNTKDTVLEKKVGGLRRYFNATDFGFDKAVGERVAACYPEIEFRPFEIEDRSGHSFVLYAQDTELSEMLRMAGLRPTE